MTTKPTTLLQALTTLRATEGWPHPEGLDVTSHILEANDVEHANDVQKLAYYHHLGLFRIRAVPDTDYTMGDMLGDSYDPAACPDIPPAELKRQEKNERARIHRQGVWGFILEVRKSSADAWGQAFADRLDSLWGNVGADFIGSGYDFEFLVTALEWLEENKVVETDPQANLVAAAKMALRGLRTLCQLHPELAGDIQPYCKRVFDALDPYDIPGNNPGVSPGRERALPPLRFDGHGLNLNLPGVEGARFAMLTACYKPNSGEGNDEHKRLSAEVLATLERLGAVLLKY